MPYAYLHEALSQQLGEGYDSQKIREGLSITYKGETVLNEVENQIKSIVTNSPLQGFMSEHREELVVAMRNESDRQVIIMALVAARYPFCYQMLCAFANQLRLQDTVSTALMKRVIGNVYGLNVKIDKAFHSALSTLVETGMVVKEKEGVYSAALPHAINHRIARALWEESFYINNPLWSRENTDDLIFEPYFRYITN
ncbi:MAG: hypothetical protein HUK17_07960 [Bacteroidales bacterium]|nr:hypothetical protein [Bacteroidales bacterium]